MKYSVKWFAASFVALSLLVGGCGDTRSEAELVADATQKMSQHKYRSAVIDLRNALRANPNNQVARVVLAEALVELGDGAAAEKEIARAIKLGASPDDYARPLARALMARGGFAELIAEIDPASVSDPALASELTAMRARAMLAMGSAAEADRIFTEVLAAGQSVEAQRIALLGKSSMAFNKQDVASTERFIRQSLEIAPDSSESYLRLGQVLLLQEKFEEAKSLLAEENASKFKLNRMEAFRMLGDRALAFVGLDELEAAADSAESMAALAPDHPMSGFLRGRIEFQRGNFDRSLEYLQELNAKYPTFAPGQALLGAVSMQRGEFEQAEEFVRNALVQEPGNAMARKLYAELRMRTSRPEDAAAMLRDGLDDENPDPQMLAMLGRAAVQAGQEESGIEYLRQSIAKDPNNMQAKLSLAAALLAQGNNDEAVQLIESIPQGAIPQSKKTLLLIVAQFDRENPGPAKDRLRQLLTESGDDPSLRSLAGSFFISTGDLGDARAQFQRVLELAPDDLGAKLSILRLDHVANDFTESKRLFTAARTQNPRDVVPLIVLARIAGSEGDRERALELAREAHAVDETALYPSVTLAGEALNRNDIDSAERYAQMAVANNPEAATAQGVIGMVQVRRGQFSEAVKSLRKAADLAPQNHHLFYELGRAQMAAGQLAQSRESFASAYELNSKHLSSLRALAILEVRAKNDARADQLLEEAQATFGSGPIVDELIGDVRASQKKMAAALKSFESAHAAAPSWTLAAKIYTVRQEMGSPDPVRSLTAWLEEYPDHVPARLMLAQAYQRGNDAGKAMQHYEILIDKNPDSVLALNNLAWLYFETSDAQKRESALVMAARATELAPDNYDIADTYGWIQFKSGQLEAGVQTLRQALAATSPKRSPDIAYHLAAALHENGATNEARETLLQALATTRPFTSRDDAQRLYDSL